MLVILVCMGTKKPTLLDTIVRAALSGELSKELAASSSITRAGLPLLLVGLIGLAALRRRNAKRGV